MSVSFETLPAAAPGVAPSRAPGEPSRAGVGCAPATGSAPAPEVTTSVTSSEWDGFVRSRPEASGYHLWGWRGVFEDAFGHEAAYLAAREGGSISGVLPLIVFDHVLFGRFAVSLPFVNYGGVVATSDASARALVRAAGELAASRRLSHVELRHAVARFADLPSKHHKVSMHLALPPQPAAAWAAVDRKARNQVRKAEKSGLRVVEGGQELLVHFYGVFSETMRDLGTPVYPRAFFEDVFAAFRSELRVFLVHHGARVVAAAVAYCHGRVFEVPWAGSVRDSWAMCPNNLIYWHMIERAIAGGFETFDFGRSTPGEGTFRFKEQWGARPVPLSWEYVMHPGDPLPDRSPKNPRVQGAIAVWKHLPLRLTTAIGPPIVRYLP